MGLVPMLMTVMMTIMMNNRSELILRGKAESDADVCSSLLFHLVPLDDWKHDDDDGDYDNSDDHTDDNDDDGDDEEKKAKPDLEKIYLPTGRKGEAVCTAKRLLPHCHRRRHRHCQ